MSADKQKSQNNNSPMPKCLYASREVFTPLNNTVLAPVGDRRASWSRVSASPPACNMRSLAAWVNRRAATVIFGTVVRRMSSVTTPTWTTTFEARSGVLAVSFTIRERERGGRLFLERKRRWRMTCLREKKTKRFWIERLEILYEPCWSWNRYDGQGNDRASDLKKSLITVLMEVPKARLPLLGEEDTGPRSLVLCGYPSWHGGM